MSPKAKGRADYPMPSLRVRKSIFPSSGQSPDHSPMATELTEEHGTALGRVNPCLTTVSVCRTNTVVLLGWELERFESPLQWAGSTCQGGQVVQCVICHITTWMKLNAHYTRCVTTLVHRTNGLVCRSSALGHRTYGTRMGRAKISQGRLTSTNPTSRYG